MIRKLIHTDPDRARELWKLFQVSYAVEADLLKATDFPPLRRTPEEISRSRNTFYGYYREGFLAGAMEVDAHSDTTHIQSLVVDPCHFRQGIGSVLVRFVFQQYKTPVYTVETGLGNKPATDLYRKFGFVAVDTWDTDHGVRKIRFEHRP